MRANDLRNVVVAAQDPYSYAALPAAMKEAYTEKEWAWLSPEERVRALRNETEPDWTE